MDWQDVEKIVRIADDLFTTAKEFGWSEEQYYKQVLQEYENQKYDEEE